MYSLPAWPDSGPSRSQQPFPGRHSSGVQDCMVVKSWTQDCLVKSWPDLGPSRSQQLFPGHHSPGVQDCLVKSWPQDCLVKSWTPSHVQEMALRAAFREQKWCPPERARELSDNLLLAQDVVQEWFIAACKDNWSYQKSHMIDAACSLVNRQQGGVVIKESHMTNAASSLVNRQQGGVVIRESHMTNAAHSLVNRQEGGVVNRESHMTNAACSLVNRQQGGVVIRDRLYQPMSATPVPSSHPLCQGSVTQEMAALPYHRGLLDFAPSESVSKYRLIEGVPKYTPSDRAVVCRPSQSTAVCRPTTRKVPMSRRPAPRCSSAPQGKASVHESSSRTFKQEKGLRTTFSERCSYQAAATGDQNSTYKPPTSMSSSPVSNARIYNSPPKPRAKSNQQTAAPSIGTWHTSTPKDHLADLEFLELCLLFDDPLESWVDDKSSIMQRHRRLFKFAEKYGDKGVPIHAPSAPSSYPGRAGFAVKYGDKGVPIHPPASSSYPGRAEHGDQGIFSYPSPPSSLGLSHSSPSPSPPPSLGASPPSVGAEPPFVGAAPSFVGERLQDEPLDLRIV